MAAPNCSHGFNSFLALLLELLQLLRLRLERGEQGAEARQRYRGDPGEGDTCAGCGEGEEPDRLDGERLCSDTIDPMIGARVVGPKMAIQLIGFGASPLRVSPNFLNVDSSFL